MSKTRTRVESQFRGTISKDGSYSPHIPAKHAQPAIEYCRKHNKKKIEFVCEAIDSYLDFLKSGEESGMITINDENVERMSEYCEHYETDINSVINMALSELFRRDRIGRIAMSAKEMPRGELESFYVMEMSKKVNAMERMATKE